MRKIGVAGWISLALTLCACAKIEQPSKPQHSQDSVAAVDTTKVESAPVLPEIDSESPRLVVDASAHEPSMQLRNGVFVVYLPADMARVLEDSLPGFTPIKRKFFDPALIAWREHEVVNPELPPLDPADSDAIWAVALSVVVGDFNGDSKRDIAMEGLSSDSTSAVFFLLSPSDSNSAPPLLYFYRPGKIAFPLTDGSFGEYLTIERPGNVTGFSEDEDAPVVKLKHDAINYGFFDKASELYYIENGVVKSLTTSD